MMLGIAVAVNELIIIERASGCSIVTVLKNGLAYFDAGDSGTACPTHCFLGAKFNEPQAVIFIHRERSSISNDHREIPRERENANTAY